LLTVGTLRFKSDINKNLFGKKKGCFFNKQTLYVKEQCRFSTNQAQSNSKNEGYNEGLLSNVLTLIWLNLGYYLHAKMFKL